MARLPEALPIVPSHGGQAWRQAPFDWPCPLEKLKYHWGGPSQGYCLTLPSLLAFIYLFVCLVSPVAKGLSED